ncbi:hypothetical protein AB0A98_06510 [Streptomyces chrestomyceticus]|uniref:hypothetical protein n=1 Tax=Streptomyces chrestomyceticus TaxID=68185 RepID=UPI0033F47266
MLATAERVRPAGALGPLEIIWHRPADAAAACDYHLLACGSRGRACRGLREVLADLTEPGQRWCPACRAASPTTR